MSGTSSSPGAWWSLLEPAPESLFYRRGDPDDPRLGEVVQRWAGEPPAIQAGRKVLVGFPVDEGVRRNGGRPGAAAAPDAIRAALYRLVAGGTPPPLPPSPKRGGGRSDQQPSGELPPHSNGISPPPRLGEGGPGGVGLPPLDLGNLRPAPLEAAQQHLGRVVGELLRAGAVPVVLGGGHETAYGHFLGYVAAGLPCTILNVDAHLDVRPYPDGPHSGSPFRQAFEHPAHSLNRGAYHVVGAQLPSVARAHAEFVRQRGGRIIWADELTDRAVWDGAWEGIWRSVAGRPVFLTVDADAFSQADVPGVSAPNPVGLPGDWWPPLAAAAARHGVRSLEIVEINPAFDRDGQTARWAAAGLWRILAGP